MCPLRGGGAALNAREKTSSALGLSLLGALVLGVLSVPSLIATLTYIQDGELELSMGEEACAAAMVPLLIVIQIPVMWHGYELLDAVRTTAGRRGAYMMMVLPVVLWSFIFSSLADAFVPSFLFGFPVFLLVAFLLPLGALHVRRDVLAAMADPMRARLACRRCGAPLAMHPSDRFVRCAWCKEYNSNPFGPSIRLEEMMAEEARGATTGPDAPG